MPKQSKVDIIKKIIDISPNDPGSISKQFISKKNGKKLGPYWLYQTSVAGKKISIRVPKHDVDDLEDYIDKMKKHSTTNTKKSTKLLDAYMDAISELSPGHVPPTKKNKE